MVIATQEDVDRVKARYDPVDFEELRKANKIRLPKVGELLPKTFRAKKLMSQKMTSVADVAFVLGLQAEGPNSEEAQRLKDESREAWWSRISKGARKRARANAEKRKAEEEQLKERRKLVHGDRSSGLKLERDAARRIAMEHQGLVSSGEVTLPSRRTEERSEAAEVADSMKEESPEEIAARRQRFRKKNPELELFPELDEEAIDALILKRDERQKAAEKENTMRGRWAIPTKPREVRVLWADLRDAAYAEQWPETVVHAELERAALTKAAYGAVGFGRSVHVISGQKGDPWYASAVPGEMRDDDGLGLSDQEVAESTKEVEDMTERERAVEALRKRGIEIEGEAPRRGKQKYEQRGEAAERLREQGIEVEVPRRGFWGRVKSMFGR